MVKIQTIVIPFSYVLKNAAKPEYRVFNNKVLHMWESCKNDMYGCTVSFSVRFLLEADKKIDTVEQEASKEGWLVKCEETTLQHIL